MGTDGSTDAALGAYGFRIEGLERCAQHLIDVPPEWPLMRVELRRGTAAEPQPAGTVIVGDDHAQLWLADGDRIELSRDPLTVCFITKEPVPAAAILHPFLGLPASIAGRWIGRYALHGGAFVYLDQAWALLGDREAGKSSTLAYLLNQGYSVLSDDILIIERETLFAGPRSVDLRDAAATLGGEPLGYVGNRPRWRMRSKPGPAQMSLGGLVQLEWGEPVRLEPLAPEDRLRSLIRSSVFRPDDDRGTSLLELAARPAWRFVRPAGLAELGPRTAQLLSELAA